MSIAVGIDLGTSNSAVAAVINGSPQVLADENGNRLTASVISFGKEKKILIGTDAKEQIFTNPKRTIHSMKRLIGRKFFSPEVKKAQALLPFQIVETENQGIGIQIDENIYTPQEISALILKRMKEIANHALQTEINDVVVTVPAHFSDNQRQATKDACKIAGLETLRIINEPTAAALAYGFGKGLKETVAVYDLGGGTFDISILKLENEVFEVLATSGDTFLGGDDFDDRIIDLCAEHFLKASGLDLRQFPQALPLLRQHAEKAKRKLSYAERTDVLIPGILEKNGKSLDFQFSLSREQFETATKDLIQRTFSVCDEALRSANLKPNDLNAVILVGGPTKMEIIFRSAAGYFGKDPLREINPDEVVAIGAAIQANALKTSATASAKATPKALLLDVTPLDLGIATVGGFVETIVEANTPIPIHASRMFTTTADKQEAVDVKIFQGKNRREENSTMLGEFEFSGFKKGRAGEASIEVTFAINTDGIVEVSATDVETKAAQKVKVKLTSSLAAGSMEKALEKSEQLKEVRLKPTQEGTQKIFACISNRTGPIYEEGMVKAFQPDAAKWTFEADGGKGPSKEIEADKLNWLGTIEDFANIPRYLHALGARPLSTSRPFKAQMHEIRFKDGTSVFAQVEMLDLNAKGFWVWPYFSKDDLPGKIFVFASKVQEAAPIKI